MNSGNEGAAMIEATMHVFMLMLILLAVMRLGRAALEEQGMQALTDRAAWQAELGHPVPEPVIIRQEALGSRAELRRGERTYRSVRIDLGDIR